MTSRDVTNTLNETPSRAARVEDIESEPIGVAPAKRSSRALRVVNVVAVTALLVMMLHVVANVLSRALFNRPLPYTAEIVGYIELPIVVLLGFVIAQQLREHLQAPIIFDRLTWGNRRIIVVAASALATVASLTFVYFGVAAAVEAAEKRAIAGVSPIEYWPVLFLVPAVFLILAISYFIDFARATRGSFDDRSELDEIGEEYDVDLATPTDLDSEPASPASTGGRPARTSRDSKRVTWASIVLMILAVANVVAIFSVGTRELVGVTSLTLMFILLLFKLPIAFTLVIPSVLGMIALYGTGTLPNLYESSIESTAFYYMFSTLPMFILLGMVLADSGLAERMYDACRLWFGWVPGGLAVATNLSGTGMATISGSTLGTAYTLGRIAVPQLLRDGYDRRLALGAVIAASLPGQIIPPSLSLMIVAGITGAAIGPQLLAGAIPGVALAVIMTLLIICIATVFPRMAGREGRRGRSRSTALAGSPRATWGDRIRSLGNIWPVALVFIGILAALYGGWMTATEAGAAGALVGCVLLLVFRREDRPLHHLFEAAKKSVVTVGALFLVIMGALMLTRLIAVTGLGALFADFVIQLGFERIGFLLVVMVVYFLLGTFMEPLPIWLLTIPILMPVFEPLGIDLLWFGVFAVIMGEIAILSPPVGILTFLMHGLVQDKSINLGQKISLGDVYNSTWMLMPGFLLLLLAMIFFPDFVTLLTPE